MPNKVLYLDCETTGTDPAKHDIIQLAGLIEIDGDVKSTFDFRCQPFDFDAIDAEALAVNGVTVDQLRQAVPPDAVYHLFVSKLGRYVNKFDRSDKFTPAGYNVGFDLEFLASFFRKNHDDYFGSWQTWRAVDALPVVRFLEFCGLLSLPDHKLATVCEHFNIPLQAHDALADITATRTLIQKLRDWMDL